MADNLEHSLLPQQNATDGDNTPELGEEPEVVVISQTTHNGTHEIYRRLHPDDDQVEDSCQNRECRLGTTLGVALMGVILLVVVIAAMQLGSELYNTNVDTQARVGQLYGMMNTSTDVCDNAFVNFCGRYAVEYPSANMWESATRLLTYNVASRHTDLLEWINEQRNIVSVPDAASMGMYGVVSVDIAEDIVDRQSVALYLSPYESVFANESGLDVAKTDPLPVFYTDLDGLPTDLVDLVGETLQRRQNVWWYPPLDGVNLSYWVHGHPAMRNVSAVTMLNATYLQQSNLALMMKFYLGINELMPVPNIDRIVSDARQAVMAYVTRESSFVVTSQLKEAYKERIKTLPIHVGGAPARCRPFSDTIVTCVQREWANDLDALKTNRIELLSQNWSMSALEVNAAYSPWKDGIFIPAGLLQWPVYSPNWPYWMQFATVGAVIMHEMGHGIDIGVWWNASGKATRADMAAKDEFEACIAYDYVLDGSERTNITTNENWADAVAQRSLAWHAEVNKYPLDITLRTHSQMDCTTSEWFNNASLDPHATSYLRINGSLTTLSAFYKAFDCRVPGKVRVCV